MDLASRVFPLLLLLLGLCNAHPDDHIADVENSVIEPNEEDITTTILNINNGSLGMLYEGDIIIPRTRTAMKCKDNSNHCLWPKSSNGHVEVPFIISEKYDSSEKSTIVLAMGGIEKNTCIRFVPRGTEREYLSIEPKFGCMSLLGRTGDRQLVSLQRFGCTSFGIVQHELLHALGFYHEHTRSDRDQFVRINWENVTEYYLRNFEKMDTNNLYTPYDYTSIMHYGRTAFGKRGRLETITPIPDTSVAIGQSNSLSSIDILRINRLYNC